MEFPVSGFRSVEFSMPARLLIVDDEPDLRDILGEPLTGRGYVTETVATGAAAITAVLVIEAPETAPPEGPGVGPVCRCAAYLEKGPSGGPSIGTRSGSHAGSVGGATSAVTAGWLRRGSASFGSHGGGSPRRYMMVTRCGRLSVTCFGRPSSRSANSRRAASAAIGP
jgi:hypothetical protein